jgi:cytochrome P450
VVEEGLRWSSPNQGRFRIVTTEVAGTPIPGRPGLNSHIAFDHGIHSCRGAALARSEATAVWRILAVHIATLSVVNAALLRYGRSFILCGLEGLEFDLTY